jgi:hypothetical protein
MSLGAAGDLRATLSGAVVSLGPAPGPIPRS